jgi:hypothetical protein
MVAKSTASKTSIKTTKVAPSDASTSSTRKRSAPITKTIDKTHKSKKRSSKSTTTTAVAVAPEKSSKHKSKSKNKASDAATATTTTTTENAPAASETPTVAVATKPVKKNRHAIEVETIQTQLNSTDADQIMQELRPTLDAHAFNDSFSVKPEFRRIKQGAPLPCEDYFVTYRPFTDVIIKKIAARHGVTRLSVAARAKLRELAVLLTQQLTDIAGEQLELCKKVIVSRQHAQSAVEQELKMRVLGLSL